MRKSWLLIGIVLLSIMVELLLPVMIVQAETIVSNSIEESLKITDSSKKTIETTNSVKETTKESLKETSSTKETRSGISSSKEMTRKSSSIETIASSQSSLENDPIPKQVKIYESLYSNKETQYKTDETGTYPEFSWQPTNQKNVLNHQGGFAEKNGWDGVTSWDVLADQHDQSYIQYGENQQNPNIQLRKYAQQTAKADEFKIKLNVRGNTTYKPGLDIVFLLDNSDSMNNTKAGEPKNRKTYASEALEKIITELKKVYIPSAENIRIGGHIFSDYTRNGWGYDPGEIRTFQLSQNTADWDKLTNEYKRADALGGTFTQRGLTEANDIFNDAANSEGRYKMLFVLTDGAPNLSWKTTNKGTPNADMFVDRLHFTNFDKGSKGKYKDGDTLGTSSYKTTIIPAYNGVINSHITTTNSTAMDMKNAGVEIHTIALQLTVNVNELNKRDELLRGLYKMSTKKANGNPDPEKDTAEDFFFHNVEKGNELTEYFKNWYEKIIRTVDKGKITDPLGDMVELVTEEGKEPKVTQVSNGAAKIEDTPTISNTETQINVDNINLTGNQEIEVEYTVRLKKDDPTFVSNLWYPTNKKTTLQPQPERTVDLIEFGSPSVKLQKADFVIPVEKIWLDDHQGTPDYWKLRPETITAALQRLEGSEWQDIESKTLNEANKWKAYFSPVEGGTEHTYRVIESKRATGYKSPTINQPSFNSETIAKDGIKITNELLRENYQFWKFMEDGKTPFSSDLPKFKVTRSDGKLLAEGLTPDATGKVLLKSVPIGKYMVEETYVPLGFQKIPDFELVVTENDPPDALTFKVNGSKEEYKVINRLKDFSLTVEKLDQSGERLLGATFKLTGSNYDETKSGGPVFEFMNLRPGIYTLTETEAPDSYERIDEPIKVAINIDGKVVLLSHPNASGSGGIDDNGNTIALKVTNKKVKAGILPNTGGRGIHKNYLAAGIMISVGVILSSIYVLSDREKRQ